MASSRKLLTWIFLILAACSAGSVCAEHKGASQLRVGLIVSDLRNPFFMRIARSVELNMNAASRGARLTVVSSGFDENRQADQFDALIREHVNLIIITPIDSSKIAARVAAAHDVGIKVVALDATAAGVDLAIMTNNYQAGKIACAQLGQELKGLGDIAIIHGPRNSAVVDRVRGCREALNTFPSLHMVSEALNGGASKEGGLEEMTKLIEGFPKLAGVFAINDLTALGAEVAARTAGRTNMIITSVDGSPEVARRLRDPKSLIFATATQAPSEMGRRAVELGLALVKGKTPTEALIQLTPVLVTRENARKYQDW